MDPSQRRMTDSVLNLTLEIMYLLTGEDYTIVKKTTGKPVDPADHARGSEVWSRNHSPVTAQSALSPSHGENNDRKVLELTNRIIHFLTGEVWQYLMGHKDLVKSVMMENCSTDTPEEISNKAMWEELGPSSTISTPSDHNDRLFAQIKNEPGTLTAEHLTSSNTSTPTEPLQYGAAHIKLETVSCDQGHLTYTEICSSNNCTERASVSIKEEYASSQEGNPALSSNNRLASYSDDLTETSNIQIADHNSDGLGTHPDFDSSSACMEMQTTSVPLMATVSQIPDSENGICFSDSSYATPPQEGHGRLKLFVCSRCGKCFSTQISLFRHKRIHIGLGEKGGCYTKAGPRFASSTPTGDRCSDKSPVWPGGGPEMGTSTTDGSSEGTNHHTDSCDIIEQGSPVLDNVGKITRSSLNDTSFETSNLQTECFNTSGHVDPWKFKKASCVDCGEVFPFKSQLILHQRSHLSKSQFSCSECGKWFTSNSHLIVHQRVHTGEKPFGCTVCPKRFATKSTLVIHQRVHTREKPYSCTECRKCFPCNSQLVIHQRTHTGEKPYSCLECGKGFISNSDLLRHRRVHTGERPFKCTECTKCFSQKSHLREHQKTHRR